MREVQFEFKLTFVVFDRCIATMTYQPSVRTIQLTNA